MQTDCGPMPGFSSAGSSRKRFRTARLYSFPPQGESEQAGWMKEEPPGFEPGECQITTDPYSARTPLQPL